MKENIADTASDAFSREQRDVLKRIFTRIAQAFEGVLLLKGHRTTRPLSMATLPLVVSVPFVGKPATVIVLSATASDGTVLSMTPMRWAYSPTSTENAITITDIDLLDGEEYDLDLFIARPS